MIRWGPVMVLAACADPVCDDGTTWNGHVDGFFREYCQGCHAADAPDRYGAPEAVTFDTVEDVLARREGVASALAAGRMPPGGGVDDAEVARVLDWLDCQPR